MAKSLLGDQRIDLAQGVIGEGARENRGRAPGRVHCACSCLRRLKSVFLQVFSLRLLRTDNDAAYH